MRASPVGSPGERRWYSPRQPPAINSARRMALREALRFRRGGSGERVHVRNRAAGLFFAFWGFFLLQQQVLLFIF